MYYYGRKVNCKTTKVVETFSYFMSRLAFLCRCKTLYLK